ncbi:hypothetical protein [Nocardia niwae]|uniref:Uncharacterized protein n=1 Tax=Nocardia niwae TaxID=626084 RepID=A0ABV2XKX7_9NOCA
MSAISDFFTQAGFWWGVPTGAILSGLGAASIAARSARKSDERKAAQEDKVKAQERDEKNKQQTREECLKFSDTVAEAMSKMIDSKGAFNVIRDTVSGAETRLDDKLELAQTAVAEVQKVGVALTRLQMTAPTSILDKAVECQYAVQAIAQSITDPLKYQAAFKAAGQAFDGYKNAFRAYVELDSYSAPEASRAAKSYMEILKKQVDDYIAEARQART